MYKKHLLSIAISLATLSSVALFADTTAQSPAAQLPTTINAQASTQQTWLGIGLAEVPAILRSQLSTVIPTGQGVMVASVATASPAQQAGLQQYDVVIRYGNQKIYSPKQLAGLVKAAQPNSTVNLQIVRQGQAKTLAVTLGKREITPSQQRTQPSQRSYQAWPMHPILPQHRFNAQKNTAPLAWDNFQNVQVKTLADGRYHAEMSYKTPQGEEKSFTFEGKRNEIIEQINQQKELPNDKKQALLNALNMNPNDMLFNQPFFQSNPFTTPFFQQGFPFMNTPHYLLPTPPSSIKPQGEVL